MKFRPTQVEQAAAISEDLESNASDLRESFLYVPASQWDAQHLRALRVLAFDNMSAMRLVPERWMPHPNSKGYRELKQDFQVPSRHDIRHWDTVRSGHTNNVFQRFFSHMSDIMIKMENKLELLAQEYSVAPEDIPESGESESSEEDEPEMSSRLALQELVDVVSHKLHKVGAPYRVKV
ncbi:hypothetical protein GX50_03001 [[Emmonsia] crescens]|uniref:Uncharacterized protein n=1 Tax=[Emmonsia] crescens TaxID=73230 RepID=A0A2B7ZLT3_9EURO|nr:hypothetical protein GX50_03001 [Emmonsia crescens]